MSTIHVALGERSYPITIEPGALEISSLSRLISPHIKAKRAVIITNPTVQALYEEKLRQALGAEFDLHTIVIPDGEQYKSFASFEAANTQLLEIEAARDITIIALGGGVIGDLTGFVAACYQRGVPFIQVPTTLLSQVDSSVGGKTAINHPLGKNMVGAFYQPQAVIIDTNTLSTLPAREFAAGMAEVIKYGIIYDGAFFSWLENHTSELKALKPEALQYAIRRCCEIKAEVVSQDEKESGIRALLNLGHTFGHAIEAEQGYGKWLHGEAVAAGIVLASQVAMQKQWLSETDFRRIEDLLKKFDLPIKKPDDMNYDDFMRHMRRDKKVESGNIRFVIPQSIGAAIVTKDVSEAELHNIL
ncbi:3-dehydroquinate synthase [Paraneptunicella aestuarii]|uniref:3-dehydroquinate synthase n=1 Tax=Paraneptunicella aestuarii TaxID=2831148 RepID=UPI001E54CBD9|nr:3-dehydroquinate synthase [Paraneptunicella aestuarii]UAA38540.1 3-dehydroquinate synthase [Paraneptunicella aestuarii]